MKGLANDRPIFHSEADFQHSIAWRIHQTHPECGVRLEYRPPLNPPMYLDLWLASLGIAIELKYRTRELTLAHNGESFALRNQSANDISRYSFLKDIQRLESLAGLLGARVGYAIFLTNDHLYWRESSRRDTVDAAFHLHEDRLLNGEMAWSERASAGTMKDREEPICLKGSYAARWRDYGDVGSERYSRFRYLAIRTTC